MSEDLQRQTHGQKKSSYVPLRQKAEWMTGSLGSRDAASELTGQSKLLDTTLRCRHEIKYLVSESKAEAIMRFTEAHLPLDRYCKSQPSGAYPIVTLYLDSHNLQLCRESLDGCKNRFKLRIRSYTDDTDYPRFFEIKRRMNTIIIKDRARVKHHNVASLLSGLSPLPTDYSTDDETLRQFLLYKNSINAGPVISVRYIRRAYEGTSETRVRVTFDRQLAFKAGNVPEVSFAGSGWQRHPMRGVILEVKFTGRYPAWIGQMVKCFDLRQQSLSKYTRSVRGSCSFRFCAPKIPLRIY